MSEAKLEKLKEREDKIKEQIKQEKAKQRAIKQRARNHRLIEVGAILESATGVDFIDKADREILLKVLTEKRQGSNGYEYSIASMIVNAIQKHTKIDEY